MQDRPVYRCKACDACFINPDTEELSGYLCYFCPSCGAEKDFIDPLAEAEVIDAFWAIVRLEFTPTRINTFRLMCRDEMGD